MSYDDYRGRGYEDVRRGAYGRTQSHDGHGYEDRGAEPYGYRGEHVHRSGESWGQSGMSLSELRAFIVKVMREQADEMFAEQGYHRGTDGHGSELHHRYKEVLEELREIPSAVEAVKKFGMYFDGLSEEERKVLTQLVQRTPLKKMSASAGVSPERFREIKHELMYKLK